MRCFCFDLGRPYSAMPSSKDYLNLSDVLALMNCSGLPATLPPDTLVWVRLPLYWHGNSTWFWESTSRSWVTWKEVWIEQQCVLSTPRQLFGRRFQGFPEWIMIGICIIMAEKGDMVPVTWHEHGLWSTLCRFYLAWSPQVVSTEKKLILS